MKELIGYIEPDHKALSLRQQCMMLQINRSSVYYKPKGESPDNLKLMETMDRLFTSDPTLGVLGMKDELADKAMYAGHERIRRLLRKMGIEAIYPKRNLSKLGKAKYIHPYLLRNLKIVRPNQVWAIDITYIPMASGFMYLTAIIDLYSRFIVGWDISNSLEKETQTALLERTIREHGKPEIINSDQGSQYTCEHWVSYLREAGIKISMDGKGRATDNAFIERWFRTLKWKQIYLYPASNGIDLYTGVASFVHKYNRTRHGGIMRMKPLELYSQVA